MAAATAPSAATELPPHRFTTANAFRMIAAGIRTEDDRLELLGGQLADLRPSDPPSARAAGRDRPPTRMAGLVVALAGAAAARSRRGRHAAFKLAEPRRRAEATVREARYAPRLVPDPRRPRGAVALAHGHGWEPRPRSVATAGVG
jgi:hypothetical protein